MYALLSTPGYQQRFAVELADPGPRVPLTDDAGLFREAVGVGARLLWLHTYTERYRDHAAGRGQQLPAVPGLGWAKAVTTLPEAPDAIGHDADEEVLLVGDGKVSGVRTDVWRYTVSGYAVVPAWLGRRTRKGTGRAATQPRPLDLVRPDGWHDEWNDELLDLLRVVTATLDLRPQQDDLLDRVLAGGLMPAAELPQPTAAERAVPPTVPPTVDPAAAGQPGLPLGED